MPAGAKLLEANRLSTDLLLGGVTVPGLDGWDGGRDQTINYIDWDDWSANDFLAVSQFRVATPGQAKDIRPDVTLFVNGIPLVVIEAKPPGKESAITDAIDQLRRYANQRGGQVAEGSEQLFWTNQFTVATTGERAEAGTFSAQAEHYLAWKDPYPTTIDELAAVARQVGRRGHAAGDPDRRDAGARAAARHRPALHVVHGARLGADDQARRPLSAVPGRQQGDSTGCSPARRRRSTGTSTGVAGSCGTPRGRARA